MDVQHPTPTTCPHCRGQHDYASGLDGPDAPRPGDRTVCAHCLQPSAFALVLRPLTQDEATEPDWQKEYAQVRDAMRTAGLPTRP